jgi:hypothetical protein
MSHIGIGHIGIFTLGLALAGTAAAQAQTAVTRQITTEPVETVVTQGPSGTAVSRRILTPEPGVTTYAPPPVEYPPVADDALAPGYVEPAAPPLTTRQVTETRVTTAAPATPAPTRTATRSVSTRRAAPRPARSETRTVAAPRPARRETRTVAAPPPARTVTRAVTAAVPSDQPLVLSPAQRQVIYRTVVQREVYPAPVPAGPPVVAQTDVYAPPPAFGYPLRAVYPTDDPYYGSSGYRDYAYGPDPYRDYRDPYHTADRWDGAPLVVGARIPPSVPLVAVPDPIVARIPATQSYSYAVIDNRVYLVDPATDIIVAEIAQ